MKQAVVRSSWMPEYGFRLDCQPYLGGALETKLILEKLPHKDPLHRVTKGIYHAGREARRWVELPEYGVPFISGSDLLKADLSDLPLISREQVARNPAFTVRSGYTLITRSGTIGKMAYARPDMDGMACSEHVMRVVPDPDKIPPGYLYAFLSSKFGVPLVVSGTYGSIIQSIEPEHLAKIEVPRLGADQELRAHELVQSAAQALATYSQTLQAATKQLLTKAGIPDVPRHQWIEDHRRLGWAQFSARSDSLRALTYDARIAGHFELIRSKAHSQLGTLCEPAYFRGRTVFSRIDADAEFGVMLVGQREAFRVWPDGRIISRDSISKLGLMVPPGTTLIPSHGTLGEYELYCRATIVTERTSAYAFSGDFFRCVPREGAIPAGYLFAFLRSEVAFRMLRSISAGGKQQEQNAILMYELPIPRLPGAAEAAIAAMVDEAAQAFDHALDCEEQARELVEEAINQAGA